MSQNFLRPNDVDYDEEEDEEELDGLSDEEGGLQVDDIYIPPPAKPACSTESTGPRLIITKIINEFFKSYGRKEIVGPFHHRMNAIIGPNGSGKSNIIDSILFVLGYRASKIRCKKLSVLIHNSEKFMNVEACTVAVHFALIEDIDDNNFRVVPGSEFVISRTAHLDNTSFYSLNGKRVQFKDVARLLKQHGVDLDHNRFLILQGEVEQISLMKPKAQNEHETGMLEYLEDVIGTTRYKEPLKKLEDRVESLTEQRMEKLNRVRISQKTLEELKGPMQEAVEHLKMENAVAEMKNVLYQSYMLDLKGQLQEKETARDELLATQNEANEKLKAIGDEIKASDTELKKGMKTYEKVEEKKNTISAAFNVASNRDSQLQADMTETNKKRKKTKELLAEEQKKLLKLERAPEENQRTIVECEKKIEQMSVKKEKLEQERLAVTATIRADTQHLQDRKDKLLTDLLKLNEAVVTTKSAFNLAETELQMCLESQRSEQTKLENLQREQQQSENLQSERTIAVDELKTQIPAKERALADARRELAGIKSREGDLVDDLRRKRMRLEESRSSMQATSSRGRVLDALMKMKREGKCPGLFGRLGDLGAIDKKYDVAVSTACGPLDNIVVDTVETAQWCIEHLKKYNIGVATFIALKNQEHLRQQASTQISTPENAPRLFDLIQIEDERVRPAFYYALRNTLVADDLDQACRIAYGSERYRVVTLKGELIETSGTMSGGGRTVSRGRMGQSVATSTVSEADLETMARELNELEDIIRGMRTRQNELETLINQLEPEVREMKMNCDKYARELEALKQHLPRLSHHIKEQERKCKQTKADPRQVQRMEAVVKERREESERAEEAASGLQNQVEELTREIEEKSIGKLKKLDKELRETTNIIDKCKKEVTRLNVATKTSERNVRISKEKIESFEQEIAKCESDLIAMKEERATIENEAKILLTCIEELTVELANKEEGYSHIKQKIDKLKKEENKMKMEKVELDEKVKKIVGATKEIQMNIERWKSKIKQLTLHEIPDSEVPQLTVLTDDELRSRDVQQMELELHSLEEQLKTSKPAFTAIAKYKRQQEDFVAKSRDLDQISEKKKQMQDLYDSVKNKRKDEFLKGYNIIRLKLKEMYQTITLGGDANFELVDSFDPFNEGVQFNVRPPKKSWKIISNLSGGEKTLSSLALVFALHYYKPSPFYIMDEIDAALDFKNVSIIANFIKERTKNAQFVIISLRDNMFSLGDILIGVYKVYNCTQTVAINPSEYDNETNNEQRNGIEERTNDTNYQQQSPQLNIVPT